MRIKQLRLNNFRGIKNLELNFDITQSFAVLVGINGSGKSSVLDSISALAKGYDSIVFDEYLQSNAANELYGFDESLQSIFQDRDIYRARDLTYNGLSVILGGDEIKWNIQKIKGGGLHITLTYDDAESIKNSGYKYGQNSFVSVHYSANRKSSQIQRFTQIQKSVNNPPEIKLLASYQGNQDYLLSTLGIIDFKEFTIWFQNLEDLENETRLSTNNDHRDIKLEATRQAVYSMMGEGFSNLRMKRAINKLTIHKANQEIELDWLSDGERGLLALAGDLARRLAITYPNSAEPLHEAGLVLIDEIELHLHPEWQRIIIQRLTQTFPGCQFIVTTHSPQVLSNVQPECIHILAIEDGNVVVKRPERSYGRDSNRILEDIMGVAKRPPEIEARILELFRIIHDGELDRAKDLIQELATEIGIDEPELIRATSTIHRREVIGR